MKNWCSRTHSAVTSLSVCVCIYVIYVQQRTSKVFKTKTNVENSHRKMSNKTSRVENFLQYNTLAIVPHLLRNRNTILDLRNETSVAGTIDDVDGYTSSCNYEMCKQKIENLFFQLHEHYDDKRCVRRPKKQSTFLRNVLCSSPNHSIHSYTRVGE